MLTKTDRARKVRPGGVSNEPAEGAGEEPWIVTFEVTLPEHGAPAVDEVMSRVVDYLSAADPVVSAINENVLITFTVLGDDRTAPMRGVEAAWSAMESAGVAEARIVRATQISIRQYDEQKGAGELLKLLSATECAAALEISKQRVAQLIDAGSFPAPDGQVGGRPAWLPETLSRWRRVRNSGRETANNE